MRDTSAWSGSIFTGKFTSALTLRQRVPGFNWYSGSDYYTIAALGERGATSPISSSCVGLAICPMCLPWPVCCHGRQCDAFNRRRAACH